MVLDQEFSYLELMQALVIEEVNLVIRLKGGHFFDQEGKPVSLNVKREKRTFSIRSSTWAKSLSMSLVGVGKGWMSSFG